MVDWLNSELTRIVGQRSNTKPAMRRSDAEGVARARDCLQARLPCGEAEERRDSTVNAFIVL